MKTLYEYLDETCNLLEKYKKHWEKYNDEDSVYKFNKLYFAIMDCRKILTTAIDEVESED